MIVLTGTALLLTGSASISTSECCPCLRRMYSSSVFCFKCIESCILLWLLEVSLCCYSKYFWLPWKGSAWSVVSALSISGWPGTSLNSWRQLVSKCSFWVQSVASPVPSWRERAFWHPAFCLVLASLPLLYSFSKQWSGVVLHMWFFLTAWSVFSPCTCGGCTCRKRP